MANGKILMVLSNDTRPLGEKKTPTGWYLPEVAHPHKVFTEAGYEVVFVSPKGGKTAADVGSLEAFKEDAESQAFLANAAAMKGTEETLAPSDVKPNDYVAVFYAGGHGPMFDLPDNADVAQLASEIYESHNGVVGAVCHGPVGLAPIKLSNGDPLVKGKKVTCFTNAEEDAVKLIEEMPFLLEDKLKELGAVVEDGGMWKNHVVVDGRLVTGQNPASASDCAKACVASIQAARKSEAKGEEKQSEAVAPLNKRWIPDEDVTKCKLCSSEFGLFLRKHHCRNCGEVVCYYCSQRRSLVPDPVEAPSGSEDNEPLKKVCDSCFKLLACGTAPHPDTLVHYEVGDNIKHWSTEPDAERKIKLAKVGIASSEPETVISVFQQCVERNGNRPALKWERSDDDWQTWTWRQYYEETQAFARALIKKGMRPFTAVNIIGFNSPEWFFANMGAIAAGGFAAGIYTTNGPDACKYITQHSEAAFVVVENKAQLDKFLKIRDELPMLKGIIIWRELKPDLPDDHRVKVYNYREFVEFGNGPDKQELQEELDKRIAAQRPGHCCTLIYTSGTTGNPKAVMISHDNVTWTSQVMAKTLVPPPPPDVAEDSGVSYLPLSHIAAQINDIHAPMAFGRHLGRNTVVWFARPTALKGTLGVTLRTAQPTFFFGVPRVWEKMQERMQAIGKTRTGLAATISSWAKEKGLEKYRQTAVDGKMELPSMIGLADTLVFSKVREALGLTRCRFCATGAAPISKSTLEYFGSLDIQISEVYGMSENTGPQNVTRFNYRQAGAAGSPMPGVELKIDHDPSRDKPKEGEICFRGRHVMMGYMKDPEKTQAAIDPEGWLHSGDVGRVDEDGLLRITGRIKELIITAGGENIAPVPIEDIIKTALPGISNIMMVGDKRKYNVALVTLKTNPDEVGTGFTDELAGDAVDVDPECKTVQEAQKSNVWKEYIDGGIAKANKMAVSNASKIQKFRICNTDFSVAGGELTSTLKLKRPVVMEKYHDTIEEMYAE